MNEKKCPKCGAKWEKDFFLCGSKYYKYENKTKIDQSRLCLCKQIGIANLKNEGLTQEIKLLNNIRIKDISVIDSLINENKEYKQSLYALTERTTQLERGSLVYYKKEQKLLKENEKLNEKLNEIKEILDNGVY